MPPPASRPPGAQRSRPPALPVLTPEKPESFCLGAPPRNQSPLAVAGGQVEPVGGEDGIGINADAVGGGPQAGGFPLGSDAGQINRGPPGPSGDVAAVIRESVHDAMEPDRMSAART
jgi:hypothetical protein